MNRILLALVLFTVLATNWVLADQVTFTTEAATPLTLIPPDNQKTTHYEFAGSAELSGRFVIAWVDLGANRRHLQAKFFPSPQSAARLPHMAGDRQFTEVLLSNPEEATALLFNARSAQQILSGVLPSAEGEAAITIRHFSISVVCDRRWAAAELAAAARRQDVIVAARDPVSYGCG